MNPAVIAVLILASGQSRRFGEGNKLLAPFRGQPLGAHVLAATKGFPSRYAVVPTAESPLIDLYTEAGVQIVPNPNPEEGQGASLALGISEIKRGDAKAALIVLADMPFIIPRDLKAVCAAVGAADVVASEREGRLMPPVLFSRAHFEALSRLRGEVGGRDYLRQHKDIRRVPLRDEAAIDIDTEESLHRYDQA
ncbi:nucleotidyltransferase family protein [Parvularcula marina]|uniref:Nucleotidyltransferase family protein n=1 Tax=Parvularcula marina TaxID=2292771 RepID=A0A371RIG7_9PROT|nr:nucleotidyltransferase family protein [Parvularcula marina]RFB05249.1 nucleotidyltransferase family protein [Parvularcula marina]